ncbi:MAG: HAMP domain-containing histidine kinase [Clostridia bacterium]|nr:HAMP domain-containing histidine kinase [Clostridia bacterium]
MPKRVFAKYVTAFMLIITFGFVMLLLIVTSIVSNYSVEAKATLMENVSGVAKLCLDGVAADTVPADFSEQAQASSTTKLLNELLTLYLDEETDVTIWVMDANSCVVAVIGDTEERRAALLGYELPEAFAQALQTGDAVFQTVTPESLSQSLLLRAVDVRNGEGEFCGSVAVCASDIRRGSILKELSESVITSALLVLVATMVVAYYLTKRITDPLREMSAAARDFAAGKFARRVRVQGKDEVAELAEAFNQMAESLENLETMRNSFIANVSHDLRTPMTTIAGFIDSIRDGVIPIEEQPHYLQIISEEVQRLARLVSSLLDLSRIQAGDRKFTMSSFDICEMARLILISFEQPIDEKHLSVEFECDDDRMFVNADRDAIYQIFYNIFHNALKFSREGGLLRIRITEAKDKKILVSVYNDGEGIPPEDLPMVFERFYKSDKSRGLDKSGAGLGLFIAKTIIAAHHEEIWVQSDYGKNCEFFFTLRRANAHTLEEKRKSAERSE